MVGDGERIAVAAVAELELAFEISAPKIVGRGALGQRRPARTVARAAAALDQAMAIENRMDRALGRNPDIAIEPPDQELPDLAGTPVRLLGLQPDNQPLDLLRQLVGVAHRPARSVAEGGQPMLFIAVGKSCSRSSGIYRNPGKRPLSARRPAAEPQSEGVLPSPNSLPTASTPPARKKRKVLPMCPVRNVTHVSGRSSFFLLIFLSKSR